MSSVNSTANSNTRKLRWPRLGLVLAALLLAGGVAWALNDADKASPGDAKCEEKCPVAAKVLAALNGWKAAAAELKAVPEGEQAKLKTELAAVARECPVGSRMGETLGFAKGVLASTIKLESACSKQCPIDKSGDKAACELKAARARLITGLDELAGYAAGACSSTCAKEAGAETAGLAEKALVLLASWDKAPAEIAAVPVEKRKQLAAKVGEFSQRCKTVTLMPATVEALQAGFKALDTMNGQLGDWVKTHPDLFKDMPADAMKGMEGQMALLHATAQILERSSSAMKGFNDCGTAKTETASSN